MHNSRAWAEAWAKAVDVGNLLNLTSAPLEERAPGAQTATSYWLLLARIPDNPNRSYRLIERTAGSL